MTKFNKQIFEKLNASKNDVSEQSISNETQSENNETPYIAPVTTIPNNTQFGMTPVGTYNEYPYVKSQVDSINSELAKAIEWAKKNKSEFKNASYLEVNNPQDCVPLIINHDREITFNMVNGKPRIRSYMSTNYRSLNKSKERNSSKLDPQWFEFDLNIPGIKSTNQVQMGSIWISKHQAMKNAFYEWSTKTYTESEKTEKCLCPPKSIHENYFDKIDNEINKLGMYEYNYLGSINAKDVSSGILADMIELYNSKQFIVDDAPIGKNQKNIKDLRKYMFGFEEARFKDTSKTNDNLKRCRNEFISITNRLIEAAIANKLDGNIIKRAFIDKSGKLRRSMVSSLLLPKLLRKHFFSADYDMIKVIPHLDDGTWINPWSSEANMRNKIDKVAPSSIPSKAYLPDQSGLIIWNSSWMYPFVNFKATTTGNQNNMVNTNLTRGSGFNMLSNDYFIGGNYENTLKVSDSVVNMIDNIASSSVSATSKQEFTNLFLNATKKPLSINKYLFLTLNDRDYGKSKDDVTCALADDRHWCAYEHQGDSNKVDVYSWECRYYDVLNTSNNYQYCNGLNGLGELDVHDKWFNNGSCGYYKDGDKIWNQCKIHGSRRDENYWNKIVASNRRKYFSLQWTGGVSTGYIKDGKECCKRVSGAKKGHESEYYKIKYAYMSENEARRNYNDINYNGKPKWFSALHTYSDQKGSTRTFGCGKRYSYLGNFARDVLKLTKETMSFTSDGTAKNTYVSANYIKTKDTIYRFDDRILLVWKNYLINFANTFASQLQEEVQSFYTKHPELLLPFRLNAGYMKFIQSRVFTNANISGYYNIECPFTPNIMLNMYDKQTIEQDLIIADNPIGKDVQLVNYQIGNEQRKYVYKLYNNKTTKIGLHSIYQNLLESFAFSFSREGSIERLTIPYIKIPDTTDPNDYLNKNLFNVASIQTDKITNLAENSHALIFDISKISGLTDFKFSDNKELNDAITKAGTKNTISFTMPLIFVNRQNGIIEFIFDSASSSGNVQMKVCRKENSTSTAVGTGKLASEGDSDMLIINKTNIKEDLRSTSGLPAILKSVFNIPA